MLPWLLLCRFKGREGKLDASNVLLKPKMFSKGFWQDGRLAIQDLTKKKKAVPAAMQGYSKLTFMFISSGTWRGSNSENFVVTTATKQYNKASTVIIMDQATKWVATGTPNLSMARPSWLVGRTEGRTVYASSSLGVRGRTWGFPSAFCFSSNSTNFLLMNLFLYLRSLWNRLMCNMINAASTTRLIAGNSFSVTEEIVLTMVRAYFTVPFRVCFASVSTSSRGPDSNLGVTVSWVSIFQTFMSVSCVKPLRASPIHFIISTYFLNGSMRASFLARTLQIMLSSRPLRFSKVFWIFLSATKLVPAVRSKVRLFFMKTEIRNRVPRHLIRFDK